ncbi:MAG TPA: hypothetical protein VF300_04270 [Methanothrix sp.]
MLENVPNGSRIFIDSNIFIYHFLEALLDEVGVSSQTSISYIPFPKVAIFPTCISLPSSSRAMISRENSP